MMDQYALDQQGLGVDEVYANRIQQITKQPTQLIWNEDGPNRQGAELIDYDESITRGDGYTDGLTCMIFPAMRIGFMLKVVSLALMLFLNIGQNTVSGSASGVVPVGSGNLGGQPLWIFDLFNVKETLRNSPAFTFGMCCLLFGYSAGIACLIVFQSFMTDNGKYSRGFRAGSKLLQSALSLDMVVMAIRLIGFVYGHHFINSRWWSHLTQTRADFMLFHFAHLAHGLALMLYGLAIFYLECYHDEGTYEEFGWTLLILYQVAGLLEIIMTFTNFGPFFVYIHLLALIITIIWTMSFEPLLHYHSTSLHDRTVNDSILVNNYAPISATGEPTTAAYTEGASRQQPQQQFQFARTESAHYPPYIQQPLREQQ